jgi:hypothetical protein
MRTFSLTLLFFCICLATKTLAQQSIYSEHFLRAAEHANKAEIELAKQNYTAAEVHYSNLFALMPNPSGRDVWNRALLAKELGNKTLQDSLTRTLLRKGYTVSELEKCFDPKAYDQLITPEYLAKRKLIENFFERILNEDQQLNSIKYDKPQELVDALVRHAKKIMEFTRNNQDENSYYSLETAKQITSLHLMGLIGQAKSDRINEPHIIVARGINFDSLGYFTFLTKQVETGNLHRESLAGLADAAKIVKIQIGIVQQIDNELFVWDPLKLREGVLDTINTYRRYYCLSPFSEYFEMAKIFVKNHNSDDIYTTVTSERLIELYNHNCNYNVVGIYRTRFSFTKPEHSARRLSSLKKQYYKIEFQ